MNTKVKRKFPKRPLAKEFLLLNQIKKVVEYYVVQAECADIMSEFDKGQKRCAESILGDIERKRKELLKCTATLRKTHRK